MKDETKKGLKAGLSVGVFVLLVYWLGGGNFVRSAELARAVGMAGLLFVMIFVVVFMWNYKA